MQNSWIYALLPLVITLSAFALCLLLILRKDAFELSLRGLGVSIRLSRRAAEDETRKEHYELAEKKDV